MSNGSLFGAGAAVLTACIALGKAAGPQVVSALVWRRGRGQAFAYAFLVWPVAAVLLLGLCCTGDRDARKAVREKLYLLRLEDAASSGSGGGGNGKAAEKKNKKKKQRLGARQYEALEMGDGSTEEEEEEGESGETCPWAPLSKPRGTLGSDI